MTVKAILSTKGSDVTTTEPTATLEYGIRTLAERGIGALVVLGADHRVIGILSERDIVRALAERGDDPAAGRPAEPAGAGAGPRSGWNRYTLCDCGSAAIVFAPANVSTVATTVYLSGESWWTTVTLPSPPFGM